MPVRLKSSRALCGLAMAAALLLSSCSAPAQPAADTAPESPAAPAPVDCSVDACVALTFDDGPGKYTDRLLDELAEAQAPGTFFVLGKNVPKFPEALRRMVAEGHEIASHTYDHRDLTKSTREQIEREVSTTNKAIDEAAGVTPRLLRPPYGAHGVVYDRLIPMPLVLWDVDTLDWKTLDAKKTVATALDEVKPGSILLMHDIHESSVQAVPKLASKLKERGYHLVTVSKLFESRELKPSKAYSRLENPGTKLAEH
ncbi:polysaccharide deacetylase family protein [Glutamicibacter endophyticus]|uniref:polysaccharide deacetylase family protein n=1 Tax=Glutamicibacter endophyticus TaxID=1522174 RepID=UPI003AF0F830